MVWPALLAAKEARDGQRSSRLFASESPGEPDFVAAMKWARQSAEAGSAKGQALLGYILTYGPAEFRDNDGAIHWYERSAKAGCPEGNLGYALSLARRANDDEPSARLHSASAAPQPLACPRRCFYWP